MTDYVYITNTWRNGIPDDSINVVFATPKLGLKFSVTGNLPCAKSRSKRKAMWHGQHLVSYFNLPNAGCEYIHKYIHGHSLF